MSISLFDVIANTTQQQTNPIQPPPLIVSRETQPTAVAATTKMPKLFTVESLPIHSSYGTIEGKKGLFVNGECINFVSDKYDIHQPSEVFERFTEVAQKGGLEVNKVLTNPKTGGLLLSAKINDCKILGEAHEANLVFYTSHDGKNRSILTLDFLRVACFNQVPRLFKNKHRHILNHKHYKNALDLDLIQQVLEEIPAEIQAQNLIAEQLQYKRFRYQSVAEWYAKRKKYTEDQKQYASKMAEFRAAYFDAPGQDIIEGQTAYKALQACTWLNTHNAKNTQNKLETIHIKNREDSLEVMHELLTLEA